MPRSWCRFCCLSVALFACLLTAPGFAGDPDDGPENSEKQKETELTLKKLFPEKSPFGPAARAMAFSADGRYGAYLYRPNVERRHGSDLWIYDTKDGSIHRVTSVSVMSRFQETTRAVRKDRLEKAAKRSKRGADKPEAAADDALTGDWTGRITGLELIGIPPDGIRVTLHLELDADGSVTGTVRTAISNATITRGTFDAETGELDCTLTDPDSGSSASLAATVDDGTMTGAMELEGIEGELTIKATRDDPADDEEDTDADDTETDNDDEDSDDDTDDNKVELIDTVDEKDADDDKAPRYGGLRGFTWSHTGHDMIFTAAGDLYRLDVEAGVDSIERLTRTTDSEAAVQWLPNDAGYSYLRDGSLIRVRFGSHLIEQIDPKLPRGQTMNDYRLSPDGTALAFVATSGESYWGSGETINIVSYRGRFAQVRKVPRHMSDNAFPDFHWHYYLYELDEKADENGNLGEVHKHTFSGPRDIVHTPEWAPDSSAACFSTYEQSSGLVRVFAAQRPVDEDSDDDEDEDTDDDNDDDADDDDDDDDDDAEKPTIEPARLIYKFFHHGGPNTPAMMRPLYLGDSRRMIMLTELSGFRQLHVLDPLYEQMDQLTRGRYEIYPMEISEDRTRLFALATREHPTQQDVYRIDTETGDMTRLSTLEGNWTAAAVSDDGEHVLATYADFGTPRELYGIADGKATALTDSHNEDLAELVGPQPEYFTYENRHGQTIHGHMFKPDDWTEDDQRPLLIYVYGGPLGASKMATRGSFSGSSYFFAYYMAKKHGYVTCTIDPRGASGYGALFEKSNFDQVGKPQVEDLVDGAHWFTKNMGVDAKRIGLHGWSFGGFQTQMCLYTEPDVFACGIAGAGPTEWENYNSWYSTGTIGDSRTGKTDLKPFSLLPLAKNLKSKLLLIHGMEDANVLYQDTVRVYRELLKSGKETLVELFLDPTGSHGLGGDVKTLGRYRKYEEFLTRCLGDGLVEETEEE